MVNIQGWFYHRYLVASINKHNLYKATKNVYTFYNRHEFLALNTAPVHSERNNFSPEKLFKNERLESLFERKATKSKGKIAKLKDSLNSFNKILFLYTHVAMLTFATACFVISWTDSHKWLDENRQSDRENTLNFFAKRQALVISDMLLIISDKVVLHSCMTGGTHKLYFKPL